MTNRLPRTEHDPVLAGVKAKPFGWPSANPDPDSGRGPDAASGSAPLRFQGIAATPSLRTGGRKRPEFAGLVRRSLKVFAEARELKGRRLAATTSSQRRYRHKYAGTEGKPTRRQVVAISRDAGAQASGSRLGICFSNVRGGGPRNPGGVGVARASSSPSPKTAWSRPLALSDESLDSRH
jgi:hypothetical protein